MNIEHNYEVDVNWIKDRLGVIYSPELNDEMNVATPPQFPKGIDKVWSPEHLFVAAVNACLMTTFLAIAENYSLTFEHFTSKAFGKLEMTDNGYLITEVTLLPVLKIWNETDRAQAEKVLQKSEKACLVANSIKSKVIFKPEIRVKPETN